MKKMKLAFAFICLIVFSVQYGFAQPGCPTPSVVGELRNATCQIIGMPVPPTQSPALPGTVGDAWHGEYIGRVHLFSTTSKTSLESGTDMTAAVLSGLPIRDSFFSGYPPDGHGFIWQPRSDWNKLTYDNFDQHGLYIQQSTMLYLWDLVTVTENHERNILIFQDVLQSDVNYLLVLNSLNTSDYVTHGVTYEGEHDMEASVVPRLQIQALIASMQFVDPSKINSVLYPQGYMAGDPLWINTLMGGS